MYGVPRGSEEDESGRDAAEAGAGARALRNGARAKEEEAAK